MLLPRVWHSIASQGADFEWIVVDDASEDETGTTVNNIGDPRIVYIRMPENRGVNAARNAGVIASRGRFIVFLDSDDEFYPEALQSAVEYVEKAESSIGVVLFACLNAMSREPINRPDDGRILNEYDIVCKEGLAGGDMICVYRREVFDYFRLPENLNGCEQVFVFQISKKFYFLMIDKPLSIVHRQADNLSSAKSLVHRSLDIARSYEILIENHSEVMKQSPSVVTHYLNKAMYRYGVAGSRKDVWRIYRSSFRQATRSRDRLDATGLMLFCMMDLSRFERRRINVLNRKLNFTRS